VRGLGGKVVASTRPFEADDGLVDGLLAAGCSVVRWPTLRFSAARDDSALRKAAAELDAGAFDWVVLTSPRAVGPLVEVAGQPRASTGVAAVGAGTASALAAVGWRVDVVGGEGARDVAAAVAARSRLGGAEVLFPAGSRARTTLEQELASHGARVARVEAYNSEVVVPDRTTVLVDLARGVDVVAFASPSAVEGLARSLAADWPQALAGCAAVAIGPTTLDALASAGVSDAIVASAPTPEALVQACRRAALREVAG
jgi:uroporphyrinogen-III synthase